MLHTLIPYTLTPILATQIPAVQYTGTATIPTAAADDSKREIAVPKKATVH